MLISIGTNLKLVSTSILGGPLGGASVGIVLTSASFPASSAQATAIGNLSVSGGTGTYTFSVTATPLNAVQVAGTNGVNLQVGSAASSAGSFSITIHATNGLGGTLGTFDKSFTIFAWSPVTNSVAPVITGSAIQGTTLSVSNGTWAGLPAPSFAYQWKRAGSAITGATNATYVVQVLDVGTTITCTVTGSSAFSTANVTSAATAVVTQTTLSYSPVTSVVIFTSYTGATPSTTGGTAPYTYSLTGTLPAGLSLNTSTGIISGTPISIQVSSGLVLTATDANGIASSSAPFSITVSSPALNTFVPTFELLGF